MIYDLRGEGGWEEWGMIYDLGGGVGESGG